VERVCCAVLFGSVLVLRCDSGGIAYWCTAFFLLFLQIGGEVGWGAVGSVRERWKSVTDGDSSRCSLHEFALCSASHFRGWHVDSEAKAQFRSRGQQTITIAVARETPLVPPLLARHD